MSKWIVLHAVFEAWAGWIDSSCNKRFKQTPPDSLIEEQERRQFGLSTPNSTQQNISETEDELVVTATLAKKLFCPIRRVRHTAVPTISLRGSVYLQQSVETAEDRWSA